MAILFMDGFEGLGTAEGPANPVNSDLRRTFMVTVSSDNFFLRPDAEAVNKSLSFGSTGNASNSILTWQFPRNVMSESIIIGLRFKTRDHESGTAEQPFLEIIGSGVSERHLLLEIDYTNDRFNLRRGNNLIDNTSSSLLAANTWYQIEFKFNIDNTTGSYELRLDGVDVMSATGVDTREAHDHVLAFSIQGNNSDGSDALDAEFAIDDLYVLDATGATNNDFLGSDTRVRTVFPVADGTTNDFTPQSGVDNYAMVDDNPLSESDYNDGGTLGDIEEYTFPAITESVIYGLQLRTAVESGMRTYRQRVRSGATVENKSDIAVADKSDDDQIFELDPNTSAAWTATNIAEFGVEVRD